MILTAKFHQLCSVAISVSVVDIIDVIKSGIVIKWVALKRNDPERPEFRVPRPTIQNDSATPLYADLKQNTRHIVLTNSPLSEWPIEPREGILVLIIISSDQMRFTPRQYFFFHNNNFCVIGVFMSNRHKVQFITDLFSDMQEYTQSERLN
jgi:hypothetical protein